MDLMQWIDEHRQEIIKTYQYLHTIPELGHQEFKTAAHVAAELRAAGLEVEEAIPGTGTGIIATLRGSEPGLTFALRADMDALPMQEATNLPYASQHEGRMHACGHDGNTTMVLWAAKALAATGIRHGTAKFVFQPGEEVLTGARSMIASGRLQGIDEMVTIHFRVKHEAALGQACPGIAHSGACIIQAEIRGRSAHGSRPQNGINAAEAAGLVTHAVSLVHGDPTVSHSAKPTQLLVDTGTFNIIPDRAVVTFDLRAATNPVLDALQEGVIRAIEKSCEAVGAEVTVTVLGRLPGAENHPDLVEDTARAIREVLGDSLPAMTVTGSEDFHCYSVEAGIRTTVIGLGSSAPKVHSETESIFDLDALPQGVKILARLAADKLA